MKKVIFIHNNQLVPRLKRAFLIEELQSNGFEVEYWEIQKLVRTAKEWVDFPDKLNEDYVTEFDSLPRFLTELDKQDRTNTVFIVQAWERWMSRQVYNALAQRKCYMIRLRIYSNAEKGSGASVTGEWIKNLIPAAVEKLKVSIYQTWKKAKGYQSFGHIFGISPPKTHSINRPDYEVFRKVKDSSERVIEEKYMVLLDIFFAQHAEAKHLSSRSDELAVQYQHSMNRYFDWLEKEYRCEVVIAAHPSSDYKTKWNGRKVIKNKTVELVKDAEWVIMHASTSNVLALLFNKPVVYLINTSMKDFYYGRESQRTIREAAYFGKQAYDIDKTPYDEIAASAVSDDLRKKYLYEHVTSPESENRSNADIVMEELNRIFNSLGRGEWPAQPIKNK